eukprot:11200358-Lingulodinium_polyedra.AAC.1
MIKASEAMAGPRPNGIAAALEEVATKLTAVPGDSQQHCLALLQQILAVCGGTAVGAIGPTCTEEASLEWPPRTARVLEPAPSTPTLLTQCAAGQIPEEEMPQAAETAVQVPVATPCAALSPFTLGM